MFNDILYEIVKRIKELRKKMIKKYVFKTASDDFDNSNDSDDSDDSD